MTSPAVPASADARTGGFVRELPVLVFILACSLLFRIWWMNSPVVDHDEQYYSFIGQAMLDGQVPYVDVWDRKPIGLFLLYWAAHGLLGRAPWAYLVMANMFACLGAWLVYRIAALISDRRTGWVAALLYIIGMTVYGCRGGQSELLFTPLCLGMVYLAMARPGSLRAMVLAMLLGGLAIQIKYSVAPFCAVFGAYVLIHAYRLDRSMTRMAGHALLYLALGLAPTVAVAAWYAATGHFTDFFYANFLSIFDRPTSTGRFHSGTMSVIGPLLLMVAAGTWARFRLGQSYPRRESAMVVVMTAGALASIYSTANVMAYYYALLVPFAILLAVPFIDLRIPVGRFGAAALVAAVVVAGNFPANIAGERGDRIQFESLAHRIVAHGPVRSLYVFSGPIALYAATGTWPHAKYPFPPHSVERVENPALGRPQEQIVADFISRNPDFIVTRTDPREYVSSKTAPMVLETLRVHYAPVGKYEILGDRLTLWQRTPDPTRP